MVAVLAPVFSTILLYTACSESIRRHISESEGIMAQGFTVEELEQFRGYLGRAISNLEQSLRENHCNREE